MKVFTVFLGLVLLASISGCAQIGQISDDQLAQDLSVGAKAAVKYSLQAALRKAPPDEVKRIYADLKVADGILITNLIPIFSGAATGDVLKSAVDTALALLKSKITNQKVLDAVDIGIAVIVSEITLPTNPADKLSVRTKKSVNGVLTGMSGGIEAVLPPTSPAPVPAPAPAPVPPAPPK